MSASGSNTLSEERGKEKGGVAVGDTGEDAGTSGRAELEDCWYRGERGGERTGREAMGDGGTNGKDSKIESARVDVVETTEVPDTRLALSRP